ncbi:uncharacterized protein LOC141600898 [Silene latifolia]|uniref:uncharacterized protein LOC141600898 n=1 Tax=Silene latifolia TaxID=37657 RepID=UPI003D786907
MALEMGCKYLDIYGDSKLIINQLLGEYEVKEDSLVPYHKLAFRLLQNFDSFFLDHVPRSANKMADALANIAATLALGASVPTTVPICKRWVVLPEAEDDDSTEDVNAISVYVVDKEDWRQLIIDYLEHNKLPSDPRHKMEVRRCSSHFIYYKGTLYRRSFNRLWLRCLDEDEGRHAMEEAHAAWGLDVVGPLPNKSSAGHLYILAGTDYFSKWAEAVPFREVKKENVVDFVRTQTIYRYGVPRYIITDNGKPFFNKLMDALIEKFKFAQHKSSMYNAPANGLAEAFNKTLCNLLKKMSTPYALVYGVEEDLPLELEIPSLCMAVQMGLAEGENDKLRLAELEALDEKRLDAQQKLECYQARLSRAFNKKVRPRSFQVGDMVLAIRRPVIMPRKAGSKFTSKWDGPYVVQEVYTNDAYKIVDSEGVRVGPINAKFLKRYYA